MASQTIGSCGPFATSPPASSAATSTVTVVASCVVVPNLSVWFQRFIGSVSSKGHPAHVSSLSGPDTTVWYAASYTKTTGWRVRSSASAFLLPFGMPPFASWPSCSRHGSSASLTVGLSVTGRLHRTATGFPCSALVRYDRCRASPIPRDRGALMADILTSAITAASQRRVLSFAAASHLPKLWVTRLTEIHVLRPSGLPLACNR